LPIVSLHCVVRSYYCHIQAFVIFAAFRIRLSMRFPWPAGQLDVFKSYVHSATLCLLIPLRSALSLTTCAMKDSEGRFSERCNRKQTGWSYSKKRTVPMFALHISQFSQCFG